ncbi:MAG: glucose-1-phosphate cytidylyltransferase [Candidatus Omnitrophica bacterium]|nr:glucose-1-phosphate cytidylyltransferase [Candidatus Omnitrophota bacterium]
MKVVILCGGYGTRIRDVAEDIPKPMIPVGGYPILWHIMKYYASYDHHEFVLCLGYKSQVIRNFFINYEVNMNDVTIALDRKSPVVFHNAHQELDWKITLAETGLNTMTGARVRKIKKYVADDDHFLLTYGDGVGDIDIKKLVDFHLAHGKILTVSGVRPPGRFGELTSDGKGRVLEFNEKTQAAAGQISGGFFVCRKDIFKYLDDRDDQLFELEPMQKLVSDGQLMVYEHKGFWQPMDTARDYALLNTLFNEGKAPWAIWK